IPGGNYLHMGDSLTPETTHRLNAAVHDGLNYLGICAGGLLAGAGGSGAPGSGSNTLNLTSGVRFGFYAIVNKGVQQAAVPITCADAPVIEHYWEDGPQFEGWGQVVGKYPDGTPAIVEDKVGKGWVILCGIHPEAPENWRRDLNFSTPAKAANDYTITLINA